MVPSIKDMCISHKSTIEQVLKVITLNAQGICFVIGDEGEFIGVITDGDIRRSLLSGHSLASEAIKIVNTKAVSLPINTSSETIQTLLSQQVRHIPLLDENKRPVDYACVHRLHQIPVMEPHLNGNELAYVTECIKSGWISSKGSFVTQFENSLAQFCDTPYSLAVSNGTTALHLALEALGVGPGDEVIVPDFTFAASINSILYTGATPVIVDISRDSWTIDLEEVKKAITPKTKAIMPVHIYGHPCDMDGLSEIAEKYNLLIVEDCAEALGSTYKGRPVGSFGDAAAFSFFGNKVITTGEGGAVLFKKKEYYERGKILRDHGMSPEKRYWHEVVGYNYRMTNIQAAIGVAQMEQLPVFLNKRREMALEYKKAFENVPQVTVQPLKDGMTSCNWLYTILIDDINFSRNELILKLLRNGIETRPVFYTLHEMPLYERYAQGRKFPVSTEISKRGISLPSSVTVTSSEIKRIVACMKSLIEFNYLVDNVL